MRGPLGARWNTRLFGTYLRFHVAMLLASLLAVAGSVVLLGVGGVWGLLGLFAVAVCPFVAFGGLLFAR